MLSLVQENDRSSCSDVVNFLRNWRIVKLLPNAWENSAAKQVESKFSSHNLNVT